MGHHVQGCTIVHLWIQQSTGDLSGLLAIISSTNWLSKFTQSCCSNHPLTLILRPSFPCVYHVFFSHGIYVLELLALLLQILLSCCHQQHHTNQLCAKFGSNCCYQQGSYTYEPWAVWSQLCMVNVSQCFSWFWSWMWSEQTRRLFLCVLWLLHLLLCSIML